MQVHRSSPSLTITTNRVGLLTQAPGKCQVAVILQVPSISFAQRESSTEVKLSCPFERVTRDSTLAILIAFSRYASTTTCVVTATGPDVTTTLRLMFAAKTLGNTALESVPICIGTPSWASGSASVAGLSTRCCPLPLAVDDVDFMSSLLLGFGTGSIGFSVNSSGVDSDNFGAGGLW